jgi:hypothetical protein
MNSPFFVVRSSGHSDTEASLCKKPIEGDSIGFLTSYLDKHQSEPVDVFHFPNVT